MFYIIILPPGGDRTLYNLINENMGMKWYALGYKLVSLWLQNGMVQNGLVTKHLETFLDLSKAYRSK